MVFLVFCICMCVCCFSFLPGWSFPCFVSVLFVPWRLLFLIYDVLAVFVCLWSSFIRVFCFPVVLLGFHDLLFLFPSILGMCFFVNCLFFRFVLVRVSCFSPCRMQFFFTSPHVSGSLFSVSPYLFA